MAMSADSEAVSYIYKKFGLCQNIEMEVTDLKNTAANLTGVVKLLAEA